MRKEYGRYSVNYNINELLPYDNGELDIYVYEPQEDLEYGEFVCTLKRKYFRYNDEERLFKSCTGII